MEWIVSYLSNEISDSYQAPIYILASLIELQQLIQNSTFIVMSDGTNVENGIIANCSKQSKIEENAEYAVGVYYIICLFVFSMMVKRVSYKKEQCNGRPGLVLAMNMLNSHDYIIEYTLIFLSLSEEIYNYIFGIKSEFAAYIPIIKFFIKLGIVFAFSIFSYPIFAAITNRHLMGYSLVLASTIAYFAIGISSTYTTYYCIVGIKIIPLLFITIVYSCIDFSIVCMFIWKTGSHIAHNGLRNKEIAPFVKHDFDYSTMYVKELFKENLSNEILVKDDKDKTVDEKKEDPQGVSEEGFKFLVSNLKCDELKGKVKEKIYRQIPGFSIPPRLIIGIFVGLYYAYRIFLDNLYNMTPLAWNLINNIKSKYIILNISLERAFTLVTSNYSNFQKLEIQNAYRYLVFFYAYLFIGCLLCAIFIGFVNSIIQSFLLLRNYRLHFHRITRKGFSTILNRKEAPDPYVLVLGFVKYSGFQAAFTLWGILVVTFFTFAVLYFLIGSFLLPLFYVENSWARRLVINYGPVLVATIIFNMIQTLIVKYVFVLEKGMLMEVNNRRMFMIYTHCAFFLNAMMGIFNSVKRVIIWLFTGAFCFQRIDFSALPDYLKGSDTGYMCYVGFLFTEQYHFNPILKCFVKFLSEHQDKRSGKGLELYAEDDRKHLRYRNLWHVAFTLMNNQKLLMERKEFIRFNNQPD